MPNIFLDIPSDGTPVDISALGRVKTITAEPTPGGVSNIEISTDGGATWAALISFQITEKITREFAASHVRAFGFSTLSIGANDSGALFADLPIGVAVDVSPLGTFNTVVVGGVLSFRGLVDIEASDDGVSWVPCMTFQGVGQKSKAFAAKWLRATRSGVGLGGGIPVVSVGAINDAAEGTALCDDNPEQVSTENPNPGQSEEASRCDHVHTVPTGAPVTVRGANNAAGVATSVTLADHEHRLEYEVEDEGALISARPRMNFVGDGVGAVDIPGQDKTEVTIPGPNLGDGGAVVKRSQFVNPVGGSSTSSATYVDGMAGTSVPVPVDGDYWVMFESEAENQAASGVMKIGISVNSLVAVAADSERMSQGPASDVRPVVTTVQLTGLTAGDLIRALFRKVSGGGSVMLFARHLTIMKVQ